MSGSQTTCWTMAGKRNLTCKASIAVIPNITWHWFPSRFRQGMIDDPLFCKMMIMTHFPRLPKLETITADNVMVMNLMWIKIINQQLHAAHDQEGVGSSLRGILAAKGASARKKDE